MGERRAAPAGTPEGALRPLRHHGRGALEPRGHRLPMRRPETRLARGGALLVGDAAGVLDPVSGDGIYEALVTGKLATEHILAGTVEDYDRAVHERLDPLSSAGWGAKKALD